MDSNKNVLSSEEEAEALERLGEADTIQKVWQIFETKRR